MIIDELGSAEIRDIVSIAIKDTILAVAVSITIDSIGTKGHIALYSDLSCWIVETKRHKVDEDANNIGLFIDFVMILFNFVRYVTVFELYMFSTSTIDSSSNTILIHI